VESLVCNVLLCGVGCTLDGYGNGKLRFGGVG